MKLYLQGKLKYSQKNLNHCHFPPRIAHGLACDESETTKGYITEKERVYRAVRAESFF